MPDEERQDEPIAALKDLQQETSSIFLTGIRRRIYRRTAASQVASFSWQLPKTVLVELGKMFGELVKSISD
ncbi:MAG TPA: hypothetical protein VLI55_10640 [Bryobacteraceae bacterium]|nr:hypothetical protein [Bryobacteraceae bacterium]